MNASADRSAARVGVRRWRALGVAALLAVPGLSAWAASDGPGVAYGIVYTPAATRSSATSPYRVGYQVSFANTSGQVVNNFIFTGATVVEDASVPAPLDTVAGPLPAACAALSSTVVRCDFGALRPGESRSFTLVYRTPTAGSALRFDNLLTYKEGSNDNPASSTPNDSKAQPVVTSLLAVLDKERAGTYFTSAGGRLATGSNGVTTTADKFSTAVVVPAWVAPSLGVEILEDTNLTVPSCSAAYQNECRSAAVRAGGSFPAAASGSREERAAALLKLYLRLDAKALKGNFDINLIEVWYEPGELVDGVFSAAGASLPLKNCSDASFGDNDSLPYAGAAYPHELKHCINSRVKLSGGNDAAGDVLLEIYETENGRVSLK